MKTRYEVIWIDDEWDKMTQFKEECEVIHHINLHPFRTQKAGMDALDNDIKKWDAVLLDAKMFDQSEDNEVAKLDGLRKAIEHINQLSLRRKIPYFISTGQPDLMDNETFEQSFGKYYIKERDDLQLLEDMKDTMSKSTRYQVKTYYSEANDILLSFGNDIYEDVVDVLEAMHFPESHPNFDPKLHFNPMRKGLEYVFRYANQYGIIPDEFFTNGIVNLNQCFMFLIGRDAEKVGFRFGNSGDKIAPRHIQDMMSLIINVGNSNSHSAELSQDEVLEYNNHIIRSGISSKYLVFSLALQLCEISLWMNRYISEHPDKEENKKKCKKIELIEKGIIEDTVPKEEIVGIVEKAQGYFHVGHKFCLNPKIIQQNGWNGKKIRIVKWDKNTNDKTKDIFPYFAVNIQLIEE